MKIIISAILLNIFLVEMSSSLLLSSFLFNYMMGSFLTRQLFSTVVGNNIRSLMVNNNGTSGETGVGSQGSLATISQVAQAIGLDKRVDRYMKNIFSEESEEEEDCRTKKCKESSKRSRKNSQRRKKKKQTQDSDEYDHVRDLVSHKGAVHNSKEEDYSKYLIKGAQENLDDLADEILAKQDPFSFYYIMKDKHKKDKKKQTLGRSPMGSSSASQNGPISQRPQGPPPPPFKLGTMPIFIRHRGPLSTLLKTVQSYG